MLKLWKQWVAYVGKTGKLKFLYVFNDFLKKYILNMPNTYIPVEDLLKINKLNEENTILHQCAVKHLIYL